jgi:6-phosphogluconate dehydrogenase
MEHADIGLIGLAVMGENLVLNMANHGFHVAVYNRTTSKVDDFINGRGKEKSISGCYSIEELCQALKSPRRVMLMVKAGGAIDKIIEQLLPHLEQGDIIIDGGNSHFPDSERRYLELKEKGIHFIGSGVSGGEEGALNGPSMMPGGAEEAWEHIKPIFQGIAAKVENNAPCCDWVGDGGAGHFVKMVHNGIEYGDMQLICEAYHLLKSVLGMQAPEQSDVFSKWNKGVLDSYLIEITADILAKKDEESSEPLVEKILDTAGQKGTGKWTAASALDLGIPVTLIGEAVFARCLSALKDERVGASKEFSFSAPKFEGEKEAFIDDLEQALFAAKIVSYAQGFTMMRAAAEEYNWKLNYSSIALMWRGGCIIRSQFLNKIGEAFSANSKLNNLLLDPYFKDTIQNAQAAWRRVVAIALAQGVPVPALTSALAYFDGYRSERLPANLLQAQRDYFGAHTYERIDKPRGEFFHTNWTGRGGTTASSTYNV